MRIEMPVCDACGMSRSIAVAASSYGAMSFAFCDDCLTIQLEPYWAVVAYISCAGRFPDDINDAYREDVRRMLPLWRKTETEFIHDVNTLIEMEKGAFS